MEKISELDSLIKNLLNQKELIVDLILDIDKNLFHI